MKDVCKREIEDINESYDLLEEGLDGLENKKNYKRMYVLKEELTILVYKRRKNIFPLYHKKKFVLSTRFLS